MTRPYYDEGGITIYHGDCAELLPELGRFDLLCTDPAYGIGVDRDAHRCSGEQRGRSLYPRTVYAATNYDDEPTSPELLAACIGQCDEAIVWGGHLFGLPVRRGWLYWDKETGDNNWGDGELAWTTLDMPIRMKRHLWAGMRQKNRQRASEPRLHPGQKPLALMHWCLGLVPAAMTVLDPFMGSGTTLRAAKELGRRAVGIDRLERCCEMAASRLAQGVLF
jgi:site-specific DNA-methyltransferase (adenine-specific)